MRRILFLLLAVVCLSTVALADDFPPMIPTEFMEPGFHRSVDESAFPEDMRDAIRDFRQLIRDNEKTADERFERRVFKSKYEDAKNRYQGHDSLPYDIMKPHPDAEKPEGGYPLVFTTYGRVGLANVMALDAYRMKYPAYVVGLIHTDRPGPLHAPPAYTDYAFLFHEFFDWLFEEYPDIDRNRVYGSGWSRGGSALSILSYARPGILTAMVPSAGGFQNLEGDINALVDVRILSLQGADDSNSNPHGSLHAFDALEKAGALDNIFWWIEDTGHSPHRLGWNVNEVVDWMFAQTKADLPLRPDVRLTVDTTERNVPLTFKADASGSTPNNGGSIASYTWQLLHSQEAILPHSERYLHGYVFDTGFQGAPVIGTDAGVSHTLEEPGTYWLRVIVEDNDGNRRAATQKIVTHSVDPVAAFSFSRNHEAARTPIHFDASESLPEHEASLTTYAWDFGDGSSATGKTAAHSYSRPGTYTVTLRVTSNKQNTVTHVQDVTVSRAFPGYRYFRFVGLDTHQTYRSPQIHSFAFRVGEKTFPPEPMTGNESHGITLEASRASGDNAAWKAFDGNLRTSWTAHNYYLPATLDMDVGEDQRFVPTGINIRMAGRNHRWSHFLIKASVDGVVWDTLWTQRGLLDHREKAVILFDKEPKEE